jgi:hypothetical protein
MKSLSLHSICIASLLGVLAMPVRLVAQELSATQEEMRYTIKDLGVVGANFNQPGQPFQISNNGWVSGGAGVGAAEHAVLWHQGSMTDIGDPGLGGNSIAYGVNEFGFAVGESEDTATIPSSSEATRFPSLSRRMLGLLGWSLPARSIPRVKSTESRSTQLV